jgi:hypothetical protein
VAVYVEEIYVRSSTRVACTISPDVGRPRRSGGKGAREVGVDGVRKHCSASVFITYCVIIPGSIRTSNKRGLLSRPFSSAAATRYPHSSANNLSIREALAPASVPAPAVDDRRLLLRSFSSGRGDNYCREMLEKQQCSLQSRRFVLFRPFFTSSAESRERLFAFFLSPPPPPHRLLLFPIYCCFFYLFTFLFPPYLLPCTAPWSAGNA